MTDYTIVSRFRNKEQVESLVAALRARGKSCYNFCEMPADSENPDGHPEEQMKKFESTKNFYNDKYFHKLFRRDQAGIKNAKTVILLLPAGISAHIEIGIAYGLGKKCVLIGEPVKAESLYLIFSEHYESIEEFLKSIK